MTRSEISQISLNDLAKSLEAAADHKWITSVDCHMPRVTCILGDLREIAETTKVPGSFIASAILLAVHTAGDGDTALGGTASDDLPIYDSEVYEHEKRCDV